MIKYITLKTSYDANVNAGYINLKDNFRGEVVATDSFTLPNHLYFGSINMDFDTNNALLGIEIMAAKQIFPPSLLQKFNAQSYSFSTVQIAYDSEANTAFIKLAENFAETDVAARESFEIPDILPLGKIYMHFDKNDAILGIEITDAKHILPSTIIKRFEIQQ
jgi:uncharacterized protein YuzE